MDTLDIIKSLNSKLFHDLGNNITALSLSSDAGSNEQSKIAQDMVWNFQFLRQIFVEVDHEMTLSSFYSLLVRCFSNRKINISDFRNRGDYTFAADQYQLLINAVMCISASISYYGNISMTIAKDVIEIKGLADNSTVKNSIIKMLNNEIDINTVGLTINTVHSYYVILLAQRLKAGIDCHSDGDCAVAMKIMFGHH